MAIRLIQLRQEDLPTACGFITEAAEWAPKSQIFASPMFFLTRPDSHWLTALGTEDLVGVCGFFDLSWPDGSAEMFTALAPQWRGKGVAHGLVKLQLDYAFKDMGLRRITMTCLEGSPSAKIALSMNVPQEGRFVRSRLKRGVYYDTLAFALERPL